ncbi:hypothetical protein Peur_063600 [Populus x canadensis]
MANSYFVGTGIFSNPLLTSGDGKPQHADMDLNLCRQLREGFRMTARYELYADMLARYLKPDFEAQVISDPLLHKSL